MNRENKIPLLVIAGPTASGKSDLALRVAEKFNGEIVSADSAQIYRFLDIGTAKPSKEEQERVKHHLIDIIDPNEQFTAADYQKEARAAINEINRNEKLPIICGGTGLYIKSLLENYKFSKEGRDEELRKELKILAENKGGAELHKKLEKVDKISAEKIHPNDINRMIRALEVYYKEGTPLSETNKSLIKEPNEYNLLFIALTMEREKLYHRINERTNLMLSEGLIDEVRSLLENYSPVAPGLQVIGYRQCVKYLNSEITYEELSELIKKETRNYAKRQYTWFRREKKILWIDCLTESKSLIEIITGLIKEYKLIYRI